ncbi:DUF4407 domain-containing protein [Moraxella lacunata]|uniref:DUF4407 domain-containing protein n=1 Tax=Moraxella lacunata TaxID=477 RepID=A0A1V4GM23_MORLA|nr:DUF4407 domain-containing protein [Moraxella lacunata]OPH33684.1 hypothetical protein B5J94_12615 [Moraxella lacunata]
MFKQIWYFLTFKIYQGNLLTAGGANYLTVISVIVFLAALSEGFAWGHFGSTFTPDNPYLGGVVLGSFIFMLFWFFDRTMVTQDMMTEEHAKTLDGEDYVPNFWEKYKPYFVFMARLGIVITSLYITAPFLTQLVFKTDIENEMAIQYQNSINQAKDETLGKIEGKINEQQTYIQTLHDKLQNEIAGKKGSKYGKGPVAQSIQQEIDEANTHLDELKTNFENDKLKLETAIVNNDEQTLKSFGILMVKDSPIFRENAINKFKQEPAFKNTQYAVDGFLILVGVILILSKLLQPKSLKMYYSSRLQEAWSSYVDGNYDDYLPENEKSSHMAHMPMPQTFENIAIRYAKTIDEREKDNLDKRQKKKQAMLDEENHMKALKNGEKSHYERYAKEAQNYEYQNKVVKDKKQRIEKALKEACNQKEQFLQESTPQRERLNIEKKQVEELYFEAERLYQSKGEDSEARHKRMQEANKKLLELQEIVNDFANKDRNSPERVRAYIAAEEAVYAQSQTIKNMKDNYLSFERDMNIHKQKVDDLKKQLDDIISKLDRISQIEKYWNKTILNLELKQIELLSSFSDMETPYIKGDEAEIAFIAEQHKKEGKYKYTYYVNKDDEQDK